MRILCDNDEIKATEINIPGVDAEKALSLYDNDFEIYVMILRSYAENTPRIIDGLRKEISSDNLQELVTTVHGLKGICANIGAEELRAAAFEMETAGKIGDTDKFLKLRESVVLDTEMLIKHIKIWLDNHVVI